MNLKKYALKQFAKEQQISFAALSGESFGEGAFSFRKDAYYFSIGKNYRKRNICNVVSKISHLKMEQVKRFANSILALSNMFFFAKHNKIPNLIVPNYWFLKEGKYAIDGIEVLNLPPGDDYETKDDDFILCGMFFYRNTLQSLYGECSSLDTVEAFRDHIKLDIYSESLPDNELVVHIRSGDLFSRKNGSNANYGQPPLTFYKKVIDAEKPKKIHLVFEDKGNPVINAIVQYVNQIGIPSQEISGSLESDINYLLRARVIVAGRGTFMAGVTSISKNVKKVYFFESGYSDWGKKEIEVIKISDKQSLYKSSILSGWKNTPEQNRLMLEYPIEHLSSLERL